MAMCAKLLQIVNSAFFRLSRTITKIEDAVNYLGFNIIKQLALTVEVFGLGGDDSSINGLSPKALQQHSLLTASIASRLFDDRQKKEDAFSAALLHDIGKLILAMELPEHLAELTAAMRAEGGAMHVVEERHHGVTHAEIGAYLLSLWGLPYPLVEAVANHHDPTRVDQQGFDILAAVHVADFLANEHTCPVIAGVETTRIEMDTDYLERLGVPDKLDAWREMARKQAEAVSSGLPG